MCGGGPNVGRGGQGGERGPTCENVVIAGWVVDAIEVAGKWSLAAVWVGELEVLN